MKKPIASDKERLLDINDFIVSKTDTKGRITYVNSVFVAISNYSETELMGKPHSIVRHPDMPKAAFKDLWDTIQSGREWRGLVKNLCKDGAYYWVDAYVVPNYDEDKNIIGFTSMRRRPTKEEVKNIEPVYKEMIRKESRGLL